MSRLRLTGRRGAFGLDVDVAWDAPVLALLGPSGSGKTSLVEAVLGLWSGARGRIELGGTVLQDDDAGVRLPVDARGLGWMPQDLGLFPHLTVAENLRFGARARGVEPDLDAVAGRLGLTPLLGRKVGEISGGERQRTALGRALASRPRALLLDEPLASLDRPLRARILGDLLNLKAAGLPMIYVSHDLHEVWAIADAVAVVEAGRVVASGPVREVLVSPQVAEHLTFEGVENLFSGTLEAVDGEPGLLACATTGGLRLLLPAHPAGGRPGEAARVAVRAEDVVLALSDPGATSAQNVLPGTVEGLDPLPGAALVRVRIEGEVFRVQVTGRAVRRLGLAPGAPVTLLVKAHAVHRL